MSLRFVGLLFAWAGLPVLIQAAGYGFDVSIPPTVHAMNLAEAEIGGMHGTWMRVRGVVDHHRVKESGTRTVEGDRGGLQALKQRGIMTAVFLRWDTATWTGGVRPGGGHRMPLDLREVYARGAWLGRTYGDVVDVWEIDNEPDIAFGHDNPEGYAAFLKAMYLGLKAGGSGSPTGGGAYMQAGPLLRYPVHKIHPGMGGAGRSRLHEVHTRVIMAPLALPPGPYLERLAENGLFSYTDGFNFHYYGYQEDFTGVYRQFEDAVGQLAAGKVRSYRKTLPVFITEYGYGLLDEEARNTVEGRVRQWRWFADVVKQVHSLRIEGPMAFYWNPYYEGGINEFGLTTKLPAGFDDRPDGVVGSPIEGVMPLRQFAPGDFGEAGVQPWMRDIGKKIGAVHASPALAYLWDYAKRNPYAPKGWSIQAVPASPVVVDFIPGPDLMQLKESGAYECKSNVDAVGAGGLKESRLDKGAGTMVLYNFSSREVNGRFITTGERAGLLGLPPKISLVAGQRLELPVVLTTQAEVYVAGGVEVRFIPEDSALAPAVFATRVLPASTGMRSTRVGSFEHAAKAAATMQEHLMQRRLATDEPGLRRQGRWLVTEGVRVEEIGGLWRFYITGMPKEPLSSAMIELPLPADFKVESDMLFSFERRLVPASMDGSSARPRKVIPAGAGNVMAANIRTENGNLFRTGARLRLTENWTAYTQAADGFTMGFFGRTELPWRFFDNRPASLVFFIKPAELPAIVEIMDARLIRLTR